MRRWTHPEDSPLPMGMMMTCLTEELDSYNIIFAIAHEENRKYFSEIFLQLDNAKHLLGSLRDDTNAPGVDRHRVFTQEGHKNASCIVIKWTKMPCCHKNQQSEFICTQLNIKFSSNLSVILAILVTLVILATLATWSFWSYWLKSVTRMVAEPIGLVLAVWSIGCLAGITSISNHLRAFLVFSVSAYPAEKWGN